MSTLTSHPAPNPPSNLRFPINSSGNLGPYRLALRIDEFRIRVVMLSKRLQRHRRSIEKLSPTELQVTLDTAVHLLLRWIPDCWILGVEYGHKSQLVFRRLLSSAFYMSRMFHYFRNTIATLHMTHRLKILYSSGTVKEDMKFNARTAFYPIGWAMQEVWRRIGRDLNGSTISDAKSVEYCKLLSRAKLLLPSEVWTLFFTKNNHLKDSVPPTSGRGLTLSPLQAAAAGQSPGTTEIFGRSEEVPGPSTISGSDATLRNRSTRLLKSPDIPATDKIIVPQL